MLETQYNIVRERLSPIRTPVFVGALGFLISFAASWVPSLWRDEAATAYVASHSIAGVLHTAGQIDGVFGLYYLMMHGWLSIVGTDPLTLRFLSAIAVGVGAAAVVAAGNRLNMPGAGISAGLVFAILPRMTAMGIEARSYAMCAAMIAILGWLMLVLLENPRSATAVLYFGVGTAAVYFHLYAVLVVGTMMLAGLWLGRTGRARATLVLASAGIFAATVPLLILARGQAAAQISWINTSPSEQLLEAAVEQYFPFKTVVRFISIDQEWVRVVATCLSAVAWILVFALVARGRSRFRRPLIFALPTVILPTAAVLSYSIFASPSYTPKYLVATVPAFSILLACGLHILLRRWLKVTVAFVLVGLVIPIYVMQRQPYAKFLADDYSFIAQTIKKNASEGDAIVFDEGPGDPVDSGRNAMAGYPQDFTRVTDIAKVRKGAETYTPWSPQLPFSNVQTSVATFSRVWLITTDQKIADPGADGVRLEHLGFHETTRINGPTHDVLLWTR